MSVADGRMKPRLQISSLAAVVLFAVSCATAEWRPAPSLPRGIAGGALAAADSGELLLAGGTYWQDNVRVVDDRILRCGRDAAWRMDARLPGGFAYGGAAASGDALYLAGGVTREGATDTVWRIPLAGGQPALAGKLPAPRTHCGAAWLDERLWILGGTHQDGALSDADARFLCFDPRRGTSESMPSPGLPGLINPGVVALGGRIWVFPGSIWSRERNALAPLPGLWVFTPERRSWEQRSLTETLPRGMTAQAVSGRHILLAGGVEANRGSAISAAARLYDTQLHTWTPAPALPLPLLAFGAALSRDDVVIVGGEPRPRERSAAVWRIPVTALVPRDR